MTEGDADEDHLLKLKALRDALVEVITTYHENATADREADLGAWAQMEALVCGDDGDASEGESTPGEIDRLSLMIRSWAAGVVGELQSTTQPQPVQPDNLSFVEDVELLGKAIKLLRSSYGLKNIECRILRVAYEAFRGGFQIRRQELELLRERCEMLEDECKVMTEEWDKVQEYAEAIRRMSEALREYLETRLRCKSHLEREAIQACEAALGQCKEDARWYDAIRQRANHHEQETEGLFRQLHRGARKIEDKLGRVRRSEQMVEDNLRLLEMVEQTVEDYLEELREWESVIEGIAT
ncbi:hypothetical protein Trco_008350 [Trichoderma cornu-damae]|uniref:Uncharacterized protein n=1 Tax=Trichoderma cornu-damae TaxID=654480 RepID=A0A9P8QDZ9_9HYPO|nr:hypothetical protein Trco_008350 [Trichoderma cornu-damae]